MEVDYVVLETSGQISVIPKAEEKSVTIKDMNLKPNYSGYTRAVIIDGVLIESNLKELGYDDNWLKKQLDNYNLSIKKTLLFTVDEAGTIFYQRKDEK